jgi:hypothetical protein
MQTHRRRLIQIRLLMQTHQPIQQHRQILPRRLIQVLHRRIQPPPQIQAHHRIQTLRQIQVLRPDRRNLRRETTN